MTKIVLNLQGYADKLERFREELEESYESIKEIEIIEKNLKSSTLQNKLISDDEVADILKAKFRLGEIIPEGYLKPIISHLLYTVNDIGIESFEECLCEIKSEIVLVKTVELNFFRKFLKPFYIKGEGMISQITNILYEVITMSEWNEKILDAFHKSEEKNVFPSNEISKLLKKMPITNYFKGMNKVVRSIVRQIATGEIPYEAGIGELESLSEFFEETIYRTL